MSPDTSSPPFSRPDPSMCRHLRQLIPSTSSASGENPVKEEPTDDLNNAATSSTSAERSTGLYDTQRAGLEKRFTEIVRWGAREEGAKRRKVGTLAIGLLNVDISTPVHRMPRYTDPPLGLSHLPSNRMHVAPSV